VVVVHASKKSLIGDNPVSLKPSQESPILRAIATLMGFGYDVKTIKVKALLGIAGENFVHPLNHPIHGQNNLRWISSVRSTYGHRAVTDNNGIDLFHIIKAQACLLGVSAQHVYHDGRNTVEDTNELTGEFLYHSQHRQSKEGGTGRNGVFINNYRLL
jgi:hypothetical protein